MPILFAQKPTLEKKRKQKSSEAQDDSTPSPKKPRVSRNSSATKKVDTHWYDIDEMNTLLNHYIGGSTGVEIMQGIDSSQHKGFTLAENLSANLLLQVLQESILGYNQIHTLVVPLNLGHSHWVALSVHFPSINRLEPTIHYVDPFGRPMPHKVAGILKSVFTEIKKDRIIMSNARFQHDGYNCGPWTIAILESLVKHQALPPRNLDINLRRREDASILAELNSAVNVRIQ